VFSDGSEHAVPAFVNLFWSRKQRAGSSLHRLTYRGSFSPRLSRYFIEGLTRPDEAVYDPFMTRGTTPIEAALLGRIPLGNDADPLSRMLVEPRLQPQFVGNAMARLHAWCEDSWCEMSPELLKLFHPETLSDLCMVRNYLLGAKSGGFMDEVDRWNRMLVLACLAGPRSGHLIGPTLHPNTPLLPTRWHRPIAPRDCQLPKKELFGTLSRTSSALTRDWDSQVRPLLDRAAARGKFSTCQAERTPHIPQGSVALIVTRPPGLKPYNYERDNGIRCWFVGIDPHSVRLITHRQLEAWMMEMATVFLELYRVLKPGGHLVVEIGGLRPRKVRWDEVILECALVAGFQEVAILTNTPHAMAPAQSGRSRMVEFEEAIVVKKRDMP